MPNDLVEELKALTPFKALDEENIAKLASSIELRRFQPGTYVFRQGDPALGHVFIVMSGLAEVTLTNDRGIETVVGFRRRGDLFGETVIWSAKHYSGSVRAKDELECLAIPVGTFQKFINNFPVVAAYFSSVMVERMRSLYDEIIAEQSYVAYGGVEKSLFRRRVADLMSAPVITCRMSDKVSNIAQVMADKNISSLIVIDETGYPVGVITEKDLVAKMVAKSADPSKTTAEEIMNKNLITIPVNAYLDEALMQVIKHGVKHLAATDRGMLAGILSLVDLVKARSTGTLSVVHRIESENTLEGLRETGKEVDIFLNALVAEKAPTRQLLAIMAELHDRLVRKVIRLAEEEMVLEGYGKPPVPYCFVNMGSAGRKEQTLRTDQDNAIIYAKPEPERETAVSGYFLTLGGKIVDNLEACGFAKCKGDVMASNPKWCRSLDDWKETLSRWIARAEPEDIRMLTIFLDFRPVYGSHELAGDLWEVIFAAFNEAREVSHMLTNDDVQYRVPLSLLGGFITEKSGPYKDQINLKNSVCVHIVNCIRVFAMKHGIRETSTLGRLKELVEQKVISVDDGEFIETAFETVMMFRIRENVRKRQQGLPADNYINPHALSKREQAVLKDALSVITRLQKLTSSNFTEQWLNYLRI
ncbi:MAG: DUF294 nucleotidyltransferase-like domain-containing protein [Bacillota bacterium]